MDNENNANYSPKEAEERRRAQKANEQNANENAWRNNDASTESDWEFPWRSRQRKWEAKMDQKAEEAAKKPPKEPKNVGKTKAVIYSLIITIVLAAVWFFFQVPAINPKYFEFYYMVFFALLVYMCCNLYYLGRFKASKKAATYMVEAQELTKVAWWITVAVIAVILVGALISWQVFRAHAYYNLLG
ncbi:MAG: hypothetical protein IJG63_03530, partial [Oscillospiraceae bacterium]|nr:hypothetical protein [Oscillospiraceae bacterium]